MDDVEQTSHDEGAGWLTPGPGSVILGVLAFLFAWWLGLVGMVVAGVGVAAAVRDPDRDGLGLPVLGALLCGCAVATGWLLG